MSTEFTFLGASGYEIVGPRGRILIDAFLTENPQADRGADDLATPDVILVSHAARDHAGDAAAIALRTGAPVVCGPDVRLMLLEQGVPALQVRATTWGICVELGGLHIRPVENHHHSMALLADGRHVTGMPISFIVETEPGVRIYHSGDSAYFDMRPIGDLYRPTVGLIGCSVPEELLAWAPGPGRLVSGEMDPDEAARVAEMLGVRVAIGNHYLVPDAAAARFLELVPQHDTTGRRLAFTPAVGETIVVDAEGAHLKGRS